MTTPLDQSVLESTLAEASLLALFVPYQRPIGATTEADGLNCARYYAALVESASAGAAPWSLQFTARGQLVFLPVSNVDAALSEIWGALARADAESSCWVALRQVDGSWRDLIPERGDLRVLPAEITLLPVRFYQLETELAFLTERQAELTASVETSREQLASGAVTDAALGAADREVQVAQVEERLAAVRCELANWRSKLTGGQS